MTLEHPLHLWTYRLKALLSELGGRGGQAQAVARYASAARPLRRSARPLRKPEHALGDDVALNFGGAARDGFGERVQIVMAPAMHADHFGRVDTVESIAAAVTRWANSAKARRMIEPPASGTAFSESSAKR